MTRNCHVRFWSRAGEGDLFGLGSGGRREVGLYSTFRHNCSAAGDGVIRQTIGISQGVAANS